MGEERTWKGKHVFFCCSCCLIVLLGLIGCLHPVEEWHGKQRLREAESLMGRGDYEASVNETLRVLEAHPVSLGDQALFRMGLSYAHPENPRADYSKAIGCFERILNEFPLSQKRDEARLWLLTLKNKEEELGLLRRKVKAAEKAAEAKEEKLKLLQEELEEGEKKLTEERKEIEQLRNRVAGLEGEKKLTEERKEIEQLRNRVAELEGQLAKLKNVDLTIQEKKRAPAP